MDYCDKYTSYFDSSDKKDKIFYCIYKPKSEIRAILQISHGMCEYIERYEPFAEYLCRNGILVCGNDHIGHGKSVKDNSELGYFAIGDDWHYLVDDVHILTQIVKKEYPGIPFILLGHSMGSFIARLYLTQYAYELDGCLICSTGDGKFLSMLGKRFSHLLSEIKGDQFRSEKFLALGFKIYNHRTDKNSKFDWVSRDTEHIQKTLDDEKCNFGFTAEGYEVLASMLHEVSKKEWAENVPKDLPLIMLAGDADPVGFYGLGVKNIYKKLVDNGCNVEIKLYPEARHELLNEINKDEVFGDILTWLNKTVKNMEK